MNDEDVDALVAQIEAAPGLPRLRSLNENAADIEVLAAMLSEALRFSGERLAPFETVADREGCRLEHGRVVLPAGHGAVWSEFRQAGWTGLDIPAEYGGLGLPRVVAIAIQECFDRASVSFGMVPGAARAAARLLQAHAMPGLA